MKIAHASLPQKTAAGYTLVETLCVLALSGVLLLAGLGPGRSLLQQLQLTQARKRVVSRLENLQQLAALQPQPCMQEFGPHALMRSECGRPLPAIQLGSVAVTAHFGTLGSAKPRFLVHGNGSVSPGRIILRSGQRECALVVSLRGAIREYCH